MALHLIPDDGAPHAPTSECGCGPTSREHVYFGGVTRRAYIHHDQTAGDERQEGTSHAATRP